MDVSLLNAPDGECDSFVRAMAGAKLCHRPAWNAMVEATFGHQGYYLVARENGRICGVLPFMHVRSRLFGNRMISQPFSDYGGVLAGAPAAAEALYQRAVEIAGQCRCRSMEFRNTTALPYDLHVRTDKISMCLPLRPDPQEVWRDLRHKTRNRVVKAQREGLVVTSGGHEYMDDFYRVWTVRMRELGTPCYPRKLFTSILEAFPTESRIFRAVLKGATTAVLFTYTFKDCVYCCWGAALRDYDPMGPNYLLNWAAIEHYCQAGMQWFDFGRSTVGSGQHTFKERWGAQPVALCWQYWTPPGGTLKLASPTDRRYAKKVELWKKMPLWATRLMGPVISRSLA